MENKKKIALYLRVSSDISVKANNSIPAQEKLGIEKANNLGLEYVVFKEEGKSAKYEHIMNRPVLENLLARCEEGEFCAVFVSELDRLTRNQTALTLIKKIFFDYDVILHTLLQSYNFRDEEQDFIANLQALLSDRELKIKSRRTKRTLLESALKNKWAGGVMLPYGYKRGDNNILTIDEEEARIVTQIYDWSLEGKGGEVISNILNELNIPTRGRKSLKKGITLKNRYTQVEHVVKNEDIIWRSGTVLHILKNPIYKGERRFKDQIIPAPSIISAEKWNEVQDNLPKNKAFSGRNNKTHFYLLKGLIRCKKCGNNFFGRIKENRGERAYMCLSKRYGHFCGTKNINIDKLNNLVWDILTDDEDDNFGSVFWNIVLDKLEKRKATPEIASIQKEITFNEKKLSDLTLKKERIYNLYLDDGDLGLYKTNNSSVEIEIKKINDKLKQLERSSSNITNIDLVEEIINDTKKIMTQLSFIANEKEKQEIIREYVKEITLDFTKTNGQHLVTIEIEVKDHATDKLKKVVKSLEISGPPIKPKSNR